MAHALCPVQFQNEFLFDYGCAPLGAFMLFCQRETMLFIQMAGRIQPFERPEKDRLILFLTAEPQGAVQQLIPEAPAREAGGEDEPPEVGRIGFGLDAIDGNGTLHVVFKAKRPKPVLIFIEAIHEF